MKKLFFTLCALCLCGTMWAQDVYQDETTKLYYTLDGENATIVAPTDGSTYSNENQTTYSEDTYTIPATVGEYYSVIAVGEEAYNGSSIAGTLVIPGTLLYITTNSFESCSGLTLVRFDYSETTLQDLNSTTYNSAFNGCTNITLVNLDRNVSSTSSTVAVATFAYVGGIKTVYIGEHVTSIPNYMFRANNSNNGGGTLSTVISDAPTPPSIGSATFDNNATILNGTFTFYTQADYLNDYKADHTWVEAFTSKDNMHAYDGPDPDEPEDVNAFQDEQGLWYDPRFDEDGNETGEAEIIEPQGETTYTGEYTIPEIVYNGEKSYTVTRIATAAFENSGISGHVIIPANITDVGISAFQNCTGITEVTYEYSPVTLNEENGNNGANVYSFGGCTGIKTVNLYRNITTNRNNGLNTPFCYLSTIQEINIGPRVTSIPSYMFYNNSTTQLATINCYAAVPPTLGSYTVFTTASEYKINVPQGSLSTYQTSWSTYSNFVEMDNAYAVTISDAAGLDGSYYATYYNDNAVDIYPQGGTLSDGSVYDVTTYAATGVEVDGETAYLDLVEVGATVPAKTAVLVDGNAAGTYTVIETTAAKTASYNGDNDLYGFVYDEETEEYVAVAPDETGSYYYYKLTLDAENDPNSLGFYWGASEGGTFTGEANKAYLVLSQNALTGISSVKLKKGDNDGNDTTGISSVENATEGASVKGIYTVQGVRVSNMNQPGLYIVDGKKVLVK